MTPEEILSQPANHSLSDILRALKPGRRAAQQHFLEKLARQLDHGRIDDTLLDHLDTLDDNDPADWWK